jgi:PadR family transcriptional regulator, regulatory protein PadR
MCGRMRFTKFYKRRVDRPDHYYHNVILIMIGEFEYLLVTAAAGLGDEAYGAAIREEIESTTGRKCSIGALYTTIERLENKGLLKTWMGDATPQRGGRAKRMVRVTPKGVQAAKDFYDAVMRVSRGASWVAGGTRSTS